MSSRPPERRPIQMPPFRQVVQDPIATIVQAWRALTGQTEPIFDLPPMMANHPQGYVEDKFGFNPDAWMIQQLMNTPFTQDTLAAIFNKQLPNYGVATKNVPRGVGGFVPLNQPSRAHMVPIPQYYTAASGQFLPDMGPYGETMLHEGIHVKDLLGDSEIQALKKEMEPFYNKTLEIATAVSDTGEVPWPLLWAAENPEEHLGYTAEQALQYIRMKDQYTPEQLEYLETLIPGTKLMIEFIEKKLQKRELSNNTDKEK